MIRRLVVLLLFWVTGSGGVSAGELDSRLADLHKALVDADTRKAYDLVVGLYGNQGIEFPGLIAFHEQPAFELLSRFSSSSNSITQSRLLKAGEGRRYWETWSQSIAGGSWDHKKVFVSEEEARLAGNFAILGILAHEVAHAICENHDLNLHDSPYRELLADEYAVRMMKLWAGHPAFEQLLEGYQAHVLGGLRMAVPAKIRLELPRGDGGISSLKDLRDYCAKAVFPRDLSTASYVSLQLDRQRFLFEAAELEPLSGFLKAERARRPVRHWVNDEILLETLADGDVPPWLLVEGDPCGFWVVSEDDLVAMVAESVGLEEPAGLGSLKADKTTVWTMAGPGRSLLYIYRDGVLSEAPGRLIEFRRNEQGRITARVLAISAVKPSYFPHLYTDENSVALSFAEYGKNGIVRRWWDLHSSKKQLVAGRIDGLLYKALPKDGKLTEMGSLRGRMAIRDEAILFSTGDRIRLVDDGMIKTLAGDIRGLRDGRGAANVRLAGVELLGFDGGDLYLRSEGKSGPSFRRLKWSR